jgi:hypothetical protein
MPRSNRAVFRCAVVVVIGIVLWPFSNFARAATVVEPHGTVAGKTLGEHSAAWWQYVFSVPGPDNPLLDDTGAKASINQSGPVFYLVGKTDDGSGNPIVVNRTVAVTDKQYLFFPLINIETDNIFETTPKTDAQLTADAKANIDGVTTLHAKIDGVDVPDLFSHREVSPVFSYTLPEDNIYDALGAPEAAQTVSPAVSDGFWLMVAPLPAGTHDINFGGLQAGTDPDFTLDVTYHVNVSETAAIPLPAALWAAMPLLAGVPVLKKKWRVAK